MPEYIVEFYKKSMINRDSSPSRPFGFSITTNTIEEAAVKAVPELLKIEFLAGYNDVWNAKIIGPKNESYEIVREGSWLIDSKTGKKVGSLEKKLN